MNRSIPSPALIPLPLGAVRPKGWLFDQLRIQADGLSGHLDEGFFPDLGPESAWLGGEGESWEIGPYWLDGLVPLAWLLNDDRLKKKALRWINWTLVNQRDDGWLGPTTDHRDMWWPRAIMLKVLAQYAEAASDWRVEQAMLKYFGHITARLPEQPLDMWAKFRWGEYLVSLLWLMNRRPCPFAGDFAALIRFQGYDWIDHFNYFVIEDPVRYNPNLATHVVNHAMAVKYPGLWSLFSGRERDRGASDAAIEMLDRFHGCATGLFTGDEHLAGKNPSRGTELCAVVEYMYSLETLTSLFGGAACADRLESLCYNNLPGAFTADMWAHQYDQQANQAVCSVAERPWTNGPEANIYGLAPNYKCCTANFSQGWPKFVSHMWMRSGSDSLVAVAYGPSEVSVNLNGVDVLIEERTTYPFDGVIEFEVSTRAAVRFDLRLRIPGWADGAEVRVNDEPVVTADAGKFHRIRRDWTDGDRVTLSLPMNIRLSRRYNDAVSIHRGPLTFSLRIGAVWKQIAGERPHADYEVHPNTAWNYSLVLDDKKPEKTLTVSGRTLKMPCFSEINAPVEITAKARQLPSWGMDGASAAPPPRSPVTSDMPVEEVTLIPYGAAKLRITEFPVTGE
ncbi:MAG: glycoside hydrolase family 127 protein [Candidatus Latescibacteria bacterium]|nr:glycoside hydrolase family 127 protein [Candidatus Latescibacterota bacterium]